MTLRSVCGPENGSPGHGQSVGSDWKGTEMETLIAIDDRPENWRETMPLWAHLVWQMWRKNNPVYRRFELVGFVPDEPEIGDGGYVIIRLVNRHVPVEYRTTFRYMARNWNMFRSWL